ncbi:MAG TPA: response regulator, partial [Candidatus Binataceae bacterium]|nr:response regulator [Candidatus Binataceae bacterium]
MESAEKSSEDLANKMPSPFLMARDRLVGTLKGKRFALLGFDPEETQQLRSAIDFASARMHTIAEDLNHPSLTTLTPFDACVMNLSSELAKAAAGFVDLLAISRKPTVIIGERDEVLGHAFSLASAVHEFIIRPWTREDFYLRAFIAMRNAPQAVPEQPGRTAAVRSEPTIIVADDDRTTIMMVQSILRTWKINCLVAHNGKDAMEQTRKLKPDALLLDVSMPDMDGFQVLAALRSDPA